MLGGVFQIATSVPLPCSVRHGRLLQSPSIQASQTIPRASRGHRYSANTGVWAMWPPSLLLGVPRPHFASGFDPAKGFWSCPNPKRIQILGCGLRHFCTVLERIELRTLRLQPSFRFALQGHQVRWLILYRQRHALQKSGVEASIEIPVGSAESNDRRAAGIHDVLPVAGIPLPIERKPNGIDWVRRLRSVPESANRAKFRGPEHHVNVLLLGPLGWPRKVLTGSERAGKQSQP